MIWGAHPYFWKHSYMQFAFNYWYVRIKDDILDKSRHKQHFYIVVGISSQQHNATYRPRYLVGLKNLGVCELNRKHMGNCRSTKQVSSDKEFCSLPGQVTSISSFICITNITKWVLFMYKLIVQYVAKGPSQRSCVTRTLVQSFEI